MEQLVITATVKDALFARSGKSRQSKKKKKKGIYMCNFECSNCKKEQECRDLRPWDYEEIKYMTVKDLITKLKDAPQDAVVTLPYHEYVTEIIIDDNEVEIR